MTLTMGLVCANALPEWPMDDVEI